ncbi:MAG: hypothetical protein MJ246_02235 [Clostridia bacterium]|nr:hypothetical protein [Clostridia bacterium]
MEYTVQQNTYINYNDLSQMRVSVPTYVYNGAAQVPIITVDSGYGSQINRDTLTTAYGHLSIRYFRSNGTEISSSSLINADNYKIIVSTGYNISLSEPTGTIEITYKITPSSVLNTSVSLSSTSYTYNGSSQKPSVTVTDNINKKATLVNNTDYTISWPSDSTSVGTKTVTVTGKGNYNDSTSKTYTINPASITGKAISLNPTSCTYNGSAQKPTVTVSGLSSNDYNVSYSNNVNAGTATVTVTGKGNYTGTLTKNFTISQKSISSGYTGNLTSSSYTYTGSDQCPTATVSGLTLNTDYTVSYPSDKKNVGTKTITFTGKGNYNGSFTKTYTINARPLTDASYTGPTILEYSKSDKKTEVTNGIKITYNGMTLVNGTDYSITFPSDMTSVGDKTITITGKGNYGGTLTKVISIKRRSIITDYMTITPTTFIYDGTNHTPTLTIYDTDIKQELVLNRDYENIEYLDNVNVGTGTVRVTGIDLYDGVASKTFTIEPYDIGNADITLTTDKEYEYLKPVPISDDFVIKDTRSTIEEHVLSNEGFDFVFKDVDHVGTGSLTITPKATNINYTGSKTIDVVILGIPMTDSRISVSIPDNMEREYEDMGPVIEPLIVVKFNDLVLVNGQDYLVDFKSDMKSGGTKQVELTGLVGFRNSRTDTFKMKDDDPSVLKITATDGVYRPGDEIEFDFEFSENVFGGPNFVDLTLKPNVGQIEIGGSIMKLRYVPNSTIGHNMKMTYTVKEGDEILKGLDSYSSG